MIAVDSELNLAERTVSRILAALRDNQTACLAQVVELIREITARPDSISVQHLAELIERDVAVVAEVLRIANTIGYNPEGVEIVTVAQAIQVVGFIKIRNLAVALLLLEQAGQAAHAREAREMSALAVTCGHLAEVTSERLGLVEAGQAFVCTALRRYGELLLITFLPEEYHEARRQAHPARPLVHWNTVFGLSPLELGRRVLESMHLPHGILSTFRELPSASELETLPDGAARLAAATDLALQVAGWIAGDSGRETSLESLSAKLSQQYGSCLEMGKGTLQEIVVEVDRRLSVLRGPLGQLPLLDRVRAAALGRAVPPAPRPEARASAAGPFPTPTAPKIGPRPKRSDAGRVLLEGISEITDLLGVVPLRGSQVFLAGARRVAAALDLIDCWVFRRHSGEAVLVPFLGTGPLFPQLPIKAAIDPGARSVFTVCVQRGETVLLSRPQDPKIRPFLPEWLIPVAGTSPLVLLPVGRPGDVCAVLCGVGEEGELKELSANVRQQLQVLAKLLALAKNA